MESKHLCHARGCTVAVHPRLLMCARHWRMVHWNLQRAVWRHYRRGQEEDKKPSAAYIAAATEAIEAVAAREKALQDRCNHKFDFNSDQSLAGDIRCLKCGAKALGATIGGRQSP